MKNSILKRPILLLFALSFIFAQCKMDDKTVPEKEEIQSEEISESKIELAEDTVSQGELVIEEKKKTIRAEPIPPPAPIDPIGRGYPEPEPEPEPDPKPWPPGPVPPPPIPEPTPQPTPEIVDFPETQAEYPGGVEKMVEFINANLKYPDEDRETSTQGRVYLRFIVEEDGSITQIKVQRGVSPTLDKEAKRLVALMPKWTPALSQNKPCRSLYTLPITFRLE